MFLDLLNNLIPSSASTLQHLVIRCNDGVLDMGDMATIFEPIETTLNVLEYRLSEDTHTGDEWSEALTGTLGKFRKVCHLTFPLPIHYTHAVVAAVQSISGIVSITLASSDSNGLDEVALHRFGQLMNAQVNDSGTRWRSKIVAISGGTCGCLIPDTTAA